MRHEIGLYTGLLICGLGASYWASLPETSSKKSYQSLFSIDADRVESISYTSKKLETQVSRRDGGKQFWVELKRHSTKKLKEGEEVPKPKITKFVGSDSISKLLGAFSPFQALRKVGVVADEKLGEFGLKEDIATIKIATVKGGPAFEYLVGAKSYGTKNVFVMDTKSKIVYLTSRRPIELLKEAKRKLFERKVLDFSYDEIIKATVVANAITKVMGREKRNEKGQLQWTSIDKDGKEGKANTTYKNWLQKIKKLRVISFANEDEIDEISKATDFLSLQFESDSKSEDKIVFRKLIVPAKEKAPATNSYWAKSEFLNTWVKVSRNRMESIEKDIPSIVEKD